MRKTPIMPKRLDILYLLSKNVNWILTHLLRIQTKYRSSALHKLSFMIKIKGGKRIFKSHNDTTKSFCSRNCILMHRQFHNQKFVISNNWEL